MASTVLLSSAARLLFTTAAVFALGGRLTGAGSFTLSDIRLVELQESQTAIIPRRMEIIQRVEVIFISLSFKGDIGSLLNNGSGAILVHLPDQTINEIELCICTRKDILKVVWHNIIRDGTAPLPGGWSHFIVPLAYFVFKRLNPVTIYKFIKAF